MNNDSNPANPAGNGDYERRDIGVAGILYFLVRRSSRSARLPMSSPQSCIPISTNGTTPSRLRSVRWSPARPRTRATSASDYPQNAFPNPQLEMDERGQLNGYPPARRRYPEHLRLRRQERRHRPHSHRPRHGPDRPTRPPRARAIRQRRRPAAQSKPAPPAKKGNKK